MLLEIPLTCCRWWGKLCLLYSTYEKASLHLYLKSRSQRPLSLSSTESGWDWSHGQWICSLAPVEVLATNLVSHRPHDVKWWLQPHWFPSAVLKIGAKTVVVSPVQKSLIVDCLPACFFNRTWKSVYEPWVTAEQKPWWTAHVISCKVFLSVQRLKPFPAKLLILSTFCHAGHLECRVYFQCWLRALLSPHAIL